MLYFPQLASGTLAQYPIRKARVNRTIINQCVDGNAFKLDDPGASSYEWHLSFQNITDGELDGLHTFLDATEGQLKGFTFLDPTGNLLVWSDTLSDPAWEHSTLLQIQSNIADPAGGFNASHITNTTGSELTLLQTLAAPGWFTYCISAYVQGVTGTVLSLRRQSGATADTGSYTTPSSWRRIQSAGNLNVTGPTLTAGIVLPPGGSVNLYGLQLEAQPSASAYKQTFSRAGVFPNAHLQNDSLAFTTTAPNRHHCMIRVVTSLAA